MYSIITIFIITIAEFLMVSNFNNICNLIGTILLVLGGWLILVLSKMLPRIKDINFLVLFILTLICSIILPVMVKYFPYCGGYENIYYAPLNMLISIGYTFPFIVCYIKQKFQVAVF